LKKFAARSRCKSSLTAKARSASSKSKCATRKNEAAARRIAETIATSPLVKTAFAGATQLGPHFAAAGRSGVSFDTSRVDIKMAGIPVLRRGSRSISTKRGRQQQASCRTRSAGCGPARGQSHGPLLDLRLHGGVRPHQCFVSDLKRVKVESSKLKVRSDG